MATIEHLKNNRFRFFYQPHSDGNTISKLSLHDEIVVDNLTISHEAIIIDFKAPIHAEYNMYDRVFRCPIYPFIDNSTIILAECDYLRTDQPHRKLMLAKLYNCKLGDMWISEPAIGEFEGNQSYLWLNFCVKSFDYRLFQ